MGGPSEGHTCALVLVNGARLALRIDNYASHEAATDFLTLTPKTIKLIGDP